MLFRNKIFLSLIFLSFLLVAPVHAFGISPLKYFYTLAPGDKQDVVINIKNDTDQTKEFLTSVAGLRQDEVGRSVFQDNIDPAENWISINNKSVVLAPHSNLDLVFNLFIPPNTPPGAHYLGVGVQEHNGSAVGGRLLTLVSFQVSGRAEEKLDLIKFNTGQKYYLDNKWVGILQVKNTGNIDLELKGQIKVDGPFYKYFSNSVYLGNKLFVQSDRNLNINLSGNSKILWPGKYHAQVSVFYGLTKQTLMADLEFWYFPVWFLIVSGLILLFLLFNLVHKKIKNEVAV